MAESEARANADAAFRGGRAGGAPPTVALDLPATLGRNLKRLRTRQGYSLDRLAELSGVSRAMIGQIETAKSVPTIGLLWRVAKALDVEFTNLLTAPERRGAVVLRREQTRAASGVASRALLPPSEGGRITFHEIRIAPGHSEQAEALAPGARKNLVVRRGMVSVSAEPAPPETLGEGDALHFAAEVPHSYSNLGDGEAILYVVTTHGERSFGE